MKRLTLIALIVTFSLIVVLVPKKSFAMKKLSTAGGLCKYSEVGTMGYHELGNGDAKVYKCVQTYVLGKPVNIWYWKYQYTMDASSESKDCTGSMTKWSAAKTGTHGSGNHAKYVHKYKQKLACNNNKWVNAAGFEDIPSNAADVAAKAAASAKAEAAAAAKKAEAALDQQKKNICIKTYKTNFFMNNPGLAPSYCRNLLAAWKKQRDLQQQLDPEEDKGPKNQTHKNKYMPQVTYGTNKKTYNQGDKIIVTVTGKDADKDKVKIRMHLTKPDGKTVTSKWSAKKKSGYTWKTGQGGYVMYDKTLAGGSGWKTLPLGKYTFKIEICDEHGLCRFGPGYPFTIVVSGAPTVSTTKYKSLLSEYSLPNYY